MSECLEYILSPGVHQLQVPGSDVVEAISDVVAVVVVVVVLTGADEDADISNFKPIDV